MIRCASGAMQELQWLTRVMRVWNIGLRRVHSNLHSYFKAGELRNFMVGEGVRKQGWMRKHWVIAAPTEDIL